MNLGKVGFILSGGGFAGAYTVGFLKALAARGIKPKYVQGVSVGTLTAAKFIGTDCNAEEVEKKWLEIQSLGPSSIFNKRDILPNMRSSSLFNSKRAYELLVKDLDLKAIIDSPIEYQIVTLNNGQKRQEIFSNRDEKVKNNPALLEKIFLAAIGLPGFLPPVLIDGEWHSDGLIFRLAEAIKAKCDTIFIFLNNPLTPQEGEKEIGKARWYQRLIFGLQIENNLLIIKEIKRAVEYGYKLIQNNPIPVFDNVYHGGLPKKIQQGIKKLAKDLKEASANDNIEDIFAQNRIITLTPAHHITSLYTVGFKQPDPKICHPGDITAAIEQCFTALDANFWKKL